MAQPVLGLFCKQIDTTNSHHFELAIQPLSSNLNIDIPLIYFKVTSNFTPCRRSAGKIQPVTSWMRCTACDDIDNLATSQLVIQGYHTRHKPLIITAAT